MKKTVVFDFDGVIHSYISGWKGAAIIPDPPVRGIRRAIAQIRNMGYTVVVVSTRCVSKEGMKAVLDWLETYRIQVDAVLSEKPPAVAYVDDRAICFYGDTENLAQQIASFKPWKPEAEKDCDSENSIMRDAVPEEPVI